MVGANGRNNETLHTEGLGKRQADDEKMNTILVSIEAAINSRPLTQDDGPEALTPAHFLH
jgi:hypothetical protein